MFQTRSEINGLGFYDTLEEAWTATRTDPTIWKVSYIDNSGKQVRMVKEENGQWYDKPFKL